MDAKRVAEIDRLIVEIVMREGRRAGSTLRTLKKLKESLNAAKSLSEALPGVSADELIQYVCSLTKPEDLSPNKKPADQLSLDDLHLTMRARNILMSIKVETVGSLCQLSKDRLLAVRTCGHKTVNEIQGALLRLGLTLKDE